MEAGALTTLRSRQAVQLYNIYVPTSQGLHFRCYLSSSVKLKSLATAKQEA